MNILIPNSWLKDYLETNATPKQFAEAMSLTSVSIERINEVDGDHVFDIEVTTNRPDLMSIEGIAREASAVLPQAGYTAKFKEFKATNTIKTVSSSPMITIKNDPELVNRITAVVMEVDIKPSPKKISERLERTGIRSINNVIDVTNYIMRELGHPAHAFDYDLLTNHTLIIRKSKKGEKIVTLDGKDYELPGNDIVADDGTGRLIDLLGIMGLENTAITENTKRVLLFIDNNNPSLLRKTSMNLGIRTEAAILNEKGIDPEKMLPTLLQGVELLKEVADGKVISDIIDIYPNKTRQKIVSITMNKINEVIGIEISKPTVINILEDLGFGVRAASQTFEIIVPSARTQDIEIPEDVIEEVARIYGYHKIPNLLPSIPRQKYYHQEENEFYWIKKIKDAFKYWGFTETYTYSMVGEGLFEGPISNGFRLRNPLDNDHKYMRNALIPSIVAVADENKSRRVMRLFELSNVYIKKEDDLPDEVLHLAAFLRGGRATFLEGKGILERIFEILGATNITFEKKEEGIEGASIFLRNKAIGTIEVDGNEITFELNFAELLYHTKHQRKYTEPSKYPPLIEDVRIEISPKYTYSQIVAVIKDTNTLIHDVSLLDMYGSKKTFRITYLDKNKNLTNEDIAPVRDILYKTLEKEFKAEIG